ncbi:GEVED domain-containing protein [Flavobacterium sp.]|uniref:GEVED domain-containing protein n=1 Tax=Flavobacterium sp. TaxID=239 RepID=UPI0040344B7D
MRKLLQLNLAKVLLIAAMVTGMNSWGQMTFTSGALTQTQNFNGLPTGTTATGSINTATIGQNWYRSNGSSSQSLTGTVYGGQANIGSLSHGVYNCASTSGATDRAVGAIASGSGTHSIGVELKNTTGSTVTSFAISGNVEKYRNGDDSSVERVLFEYSVNATSLDNGTWTAVSGLDLVEPSNANTSLTPGIDGNATGNKAAFSGSIASLTITNNGSVWIRWRDTNASGTDALLALDDVSVTATLQAPSAPTVATNAASDITATGATLNGTANANGLGAISLNFEYGLTTSYGTAPASVSPTTATGSSNTAFSGAINSLTPNTTYNFRAKGGSVDGSNATFVTLANAPAAPAVDGATVNSLNITIDAVTQNNNPAATQYAIRENGGQYVQSGGSLGASAVWQTAAQWGTKTVTGLSANTSYSFQAKARNNATTQVETAFSSLAAGTTLANTAPTLSGTTLAAFGSVCLNQSVTNSFQLLGENLTTAAVTVGPLAGFTFSTTSGGSYASSLTLNADAQGTIITDVFVKFTPTTATGYSSNIPVAGGGATTINVATSATGVNTTPTVSTTAVTVFTGTTATMAGNVTVQGCTAVSARGIVYGTSNNPVIGGNGVTQVPSGSGTGTFSESVSGLTGSTLYYVRAYATNDGGTVYGSSVSFTTQCTTPVNATSFNPTAGNTQVALSWSNGSCSDEVIVVAKASSAVTATPSGDGTAYTAAAAFGSGTAIAAGEYVVYKGTGTSVTVTGLTNGTTFHFKVFTRRGSSWSSGVIASAVPALVYCTPTITNGCGDFGDGVDGFVLNGISNIDSNCNGNSQSYINYPTTSFTTTLFRGLTYEAQVTNGNYSGNIAVWIDFNNDGTFAASERFAGTSLVSANGTIYLSIPVPADATIGEHRVRVREAVNQNGNLITLDPCANYGYGETEDYTITIMDNIYPTVTTAAVASPAATTASVGGNVTSDAGSAVTSRGVVYSLTANPAINGTGVTRVDIGSGTGSFNTTVTGLQDNKQYYVRAFAINGNGTSYGAQETFTTLSMPAPALHDATEVSYRSFLASWDAVTGAQSYKLDVSTSATFGSVILIPDLIISEYIEGSSNNRSIEIYNGTGAAVNLSAYSLKRQFNGSGNFVDEVTLSGTLANGDVYVVSNASASSTILAQTDQAINGNFPTFTGNDPVALYHNGVQIDVVGTVNSSADLGANVTLIRKPSIVAPSTTYNANDWTQQPQDYFTDLGTHTYGGNTPIFVTGYNNLTVNGTSQQVVGLTPNTTYYFRVRAVGVNTTSPSSTVKNTTTLKENVWTSTGWSLSTPPTSVDKAIIEFNYNTATDGELTAGQLVINSGTFTIAEGDNVTVTNDVSMTNSTHVIAAGEEQTYGGAVGEKVIVGPKIVIEHNANLIQVNDVNNTGNAQVYKNSAPMFRLDYAMWSAPVTGETLIGFSPETLANRFYTYAPTTNTYTNTTTSNGTIQFAEGVGYLIRTPNNMLDYVAPAEGQPQPTGTRWEGNFIGTLNNGDVNVSVIPAGTGGSTGFNAVGNPYPSPINVHAFYDGNVGSIDGLSTLFFWRKRNNSESGSYAKLTKLAYSANSDNGIWGDSSMGAFTGLASSWVINPGQGFIVQATGNTIHFNNTMRRAVNNNQQFRNAQDETATASRLWLNLKGTQGQFSQAVIGYTDVTTLGADYGWDGRAFMSDNTVIYSYMGEEKLGIQARASFDASDEVQMGLKVETAGTYTISLDHMDGVFAADQDIFLRDNVLGVTHDLKQGAYEFALEAGVISGRFDVVYADALSNENPVWSANSVIIYKEGSSIKINSGSEEITAISVYDMRGRLLYSGNNINATETAISGLQAEKQVLIVNVSTHKGEVSKKIVY